MATASVVPSGGTLLLEREAQVAALEALAGAARGGDGRFVVIEKCRHRQTRLLAEARAIAGSAGRVLAARGGELEGEFARDRPSAVRAAARLSQSDVMRS